MNARSLLLWGIPALLIGFVIACAIPHLALQVISHQGWTTYTTGNSGLADNYARAITFDEQGRATEYQMTLMVAVELMDVRGDEPAVLWEDKGFSRRTSYEVDVSAVDYFDRQIEAMEELSEEFARALVTAVLEGF